ncbi:MAG TPA: hypothetical protein VFF73_31790 [Planctomycetota bacterium]|nr:hypothetical protein [Planctomycetota bacterium]
MEVTIPGRALPELTWPASSSWPEFLKALHSRFASAIRQGYADKDVLLAEKLEFGVDAHSPEYPRLRSFVAHIIRFNERGPRERDGFFWSVRLEWERRSIKQVVMTWEG